MLREQQRAFADQGQQVAGIARDHAVEQRFGLAVVGGVAALADFLKVGRAKNRGSIEVVRVRAHRILIAEDHLVGAAQLLARGGILYQLSAGASLRAPPEPEHRQGADQHKGREQPGPRGRGWLSSCRLHTSVSSGMRGLERMPQSPQVLQSYGPEGVFLPPWSRLS